MIATINKWIKKRIKSFAYAFRGIFFLIKNETNAKIHLAATLIVIFFGFLFQITQKEWCLILFAIALVMASEAFNTAIERLVDRLYPEQHKDAALIKDLSAGAVLITAIIAAIVGIIIFLPYFIRIICE